jgi:phage tail-like protein
MDVQGSAFHLLHGPEDWAGCVDAPTGLDLGEEWADESAGLPSAAHSPLQYDEGLGALRLRRDLPLFRRAGRMVPLTPDARRGAGRDDYGNWYWIGEDPTTVWWLPVGGGPAAVWWSLDQWVASCADGPAAGDFVSCPPAPPPGLVLAGLTVTVAHYLVVGYRPGAPGPLDGPGGLFVFDLQGGGPPLRLEWPASVPFAPFDLADTADGGVLVLDRVHATTWSLDCHFRLRGQPSVTTATFQPAAGGATETLVGPATPVGVTLGPAVGDPVSVEPGPDGTVLVLDSEAARGFSVVHLFDGSTRRWSASLADAVEVIDPADPTDTAARYSLLGHDLVYEAGPPADSPLAPPMLYVADAEGKQVVAFDLDPVTGHLSPRPDFLPLRRWDGKALVRAADGVWYDFEDRWVPLEVYTECRFESEAVLTTPTGFADGPAGRPFDSQLPACVWHRLFLDAEIPTGTSVAVRARAADDADLLAQSPWLPQPDVYLRGDQGELAWHDPWADQRAADGTLPDRTGTWELLFQQVTGRYLEVELTFSGGGRSSPALRSLRAWFPRFSYPAHYLPAVYQEDAAPLGFLERFLANFEGFFTTTEERIEHSGLLLDARTVPVEDLEWLAAWFGMVLEPQWSEAQRRFLVRYLDRFYRWRGTVPGLLAVLRVYLDGPDEAVFDDCAPCGSVRLVERFLVRQLDGAAGSAAQGVAAAAHRFDVLVSAGLSADQSAMVDRLVATHQPAHTACDRRSYEDAFSVGTARLGIDTRLGDGPTFVPLVLGAGGPLAGTYLGFPYPFGIPDRIVADRDRVGTLTL